MCKQGICVCMMDVFLILFKLNMYIVKEQSNTMLAVIKKLSNLYNVQNETSRVETNATSQRVCMSTKAK